MSEEHEHDWRVDPHYVFPTEPPQQRLVCAECGEVRGRGCQTTTWPTSRDPKDWPRAFGAVP